MENMKVEDSRIYMQKWYPSNYNKMQKTISRFNEKLRIQLEIYYLKTVRNNYSYHRDNVSHFTNNFCTYLNEVNNSELEYYIEFCLEFHEKHFLDILSTIYMICLNTNYILKQICASYTRYGGRKEREEMLKNIFNYVVYANEEPNDEILEILNDIMELEKKHLLDCYEKAKNGETFCDSCAPHCIVKNQNTKSKGSYKRTTPYRIY